MVFFFAYIILIKLLCKDSCWAGVRTNSKTTLQQWYAKWQGSSSTYNTWYAEKQIKHHALIFRSIPSLAISTAGNVTNCHFSVVIALVWLLSCVISKASFLTQRTSSTVQKGLPILPTSEVADSGVVCSLIGGLSVTVSSGVVLTWWLPFLLVLKIPMAKEIASRQYSEKHLWFKHHQQLFCKHVHWWWWRQTWNVYYFQMETCCLQPLNGKIWRSKIGSQ